ncbi:MAG: hypothetical protein HZA17_03175 [Nitrospirae bacterium]|nr:hypothetical protein [Nitrospirota bacterium]
MAKIFYRVLQTVFPAALFMLCVSCASGPRLQTQSAHEPDRTGSYSLILYGCSYSDDLETVAILYREDGRRLVEPFAPLFKYQTKKGLSADAAIEQAEHFVRCHSSFQRSQLRKILDEKGNTAGYEMRPLYLPLTYGTDDVLNIDYRLKDGKIVVFIRLDPSVEKMLRDGHEERNR